MKTSLIGELSRLKGARAPELKGTMCDFMRYTKAGERSPHEIHSVYCTNPIRLNMYTLCQPFTGSCNCL